MAFRLHRANEEMRCVEDMPPRLHYPNDVHSLNWIPLFKNLALHDSDDKKVKRGRLVKSKIQTDGRRKGDAGFLRRPLVLTQPVTIRRFCAQVDHYRIPVKDQATQTDDSQDPCPLCAREARRPDDYPEVFSNDCPSNTGPADPNARTKDVAIEAPDRGFYGSDQLTYFRFGNFLYRGWTYRTLDGRIEHVPRFPRGIPLDQIRVEKPLRTSAQI